MTPNNDAVNSNIDNNNLPNMIANLSNIALISAAVERLDSRVAGLPGIGVMYAPAGWGKTHAAIAIANQTRALMVAMRSAWSRKTLLEKILLELSIKPQGTIANMLEQVCQGLAAAGRILIIDEADTLVKSDVMIELVRDIYEGSQSSILLIGEELLPQKLKRWERFHSRILIFVPAEPITVADAALLAPIYCPKIEIKKDLLEYLVANSGGSVRRVAVNLNNILETANIEGWRSVDRKQWDNRGLYTGEAPRRRVA
ncbi:MAG: ATP-binding protein [Candidatus Pacebacteria bacterium]|nr:ATP-binding protein [Candidatus Paceibacterota bacterium]